MGQVRSLSYPRGRKAPAHFRQNEGMPICTSDRILQRILTWARTGCSSQEIDPGSRETWPKHAALHYLSFARSRDVVIQK